MGGSNAVQLLEHKTRVQLLEHKTRGEIPVLERGRIHVLRHGARSGTEGRHASV